MNIEFNCRVCGGAVSVSRAALAAGGHPACVYRKSLVASATGGFDELALRVWRLRQWVARGVRYRGGRR